MLAQVFKIDVARCDSCGGSMAAISPIMEPESIVRYLKHMNLDYDPPARGAMDLYCQEIRIGALDDVNSPDGVAIRPSTRAQGRHC